MNIAQLVFDKPISELKTREFRIVGNQAGHCFKMGEIVNIQQKDGRNFICFTKNGVKNVVTPQDIQATTTDIKEVEELAKEAEEKQKSVTAYLDFMKETGATTLDESAFRVWQIFKFVKELNENDAKTAIYRLLSGE